MICNTCLSQFVLHFEYQIHIPWLASWNVYFQHLNPLNVYIPQFNHGMYTFHDFAIECTHSTVLAIECIHSTVIYIQCNIYMYLYLSLRVASLRILYCGWGLWYYMEESQFEEKDGCIYRFLYSQFITLDALDPVW